MRATSAGSSVRAHRQVPAALVGERSAFYRILLGHQDRARAGDRQVGGGEAVVIRKRVRDRVNPERFELREKARRIADAGDRMHAARR